MGDEDDLDLAVRVPGLRQLRAHVGQRVRQAFHERGDERGGVEVLAHLVHLELALEAGVAQGLAEVLAVLAAARVAGVGAGGEHEHLAVALGVHPLDGFRDVRRPVAVAPVDRQVDAAGGQLGLEGRLQRAVLRVDRGNAAVLAVVVGHLLEALVGDAAAGGDVAQERDDVVLPLRAAEGRQQDRVVGLGCHDAVFVVADARVEGLAHRRTSATSAVEMRRPV